MAYENIKLTKDHCVVRDGYFYYIDEVSNVLYQKASDGLTVFTYPIINIVGKPIRCMEFDGHYFWTLQQGDTAQDVVLNKYYEDNYVLRLKETLEFSNDSDHYFDVDTFALEFYNTTLLNSVSKNDTSITINNYIERVVPGTVVTLGPNSNGEYEDVTVTGTLNGGQTLGLDFFIENNYAAEAPVYFTTNLWLLNKYAFKVLDGGALYQISLPKKEIQSITVDADFAAISASCFYTTLTELLESTKLRQSSQ
jgi:hypothetical protein